MEGKYFGVFLRNVMFNPEKTASSVVSFTNTSWDVGTGIDEEVIEL